MKAIYDHASVILCLLSVLEASKSGIAEESFTEKDFARHVVSKIGYSARDTIYFESYNELKRQSPAAANHLDAAKAFTVRALGRLCNYTFR